MAESTLSLTRTEFRKAIANMLGLGIDSSAWDADFSTRVDMCIDIGCRNVYEPAIQPGEIHTHIWSFMQPTLTSFDINATYSTGTVTVTPHATGSVVSGAGTTFPTWAGSGELVLDGVPYSVLSWTSTTALKLDDVDVTAAALSTYVLRQVDYVLPDLFGGFRGDLYLGGSSSVMGQTLQRIPYDGRGSILERRNNTTNDFSAQPTCYAVFPADQTGATGQRWMMAIDPVSDAAYTVSGVYTINPYQLSSTYTYPMGGLPLAECLREACLSAAELEFKGEAGIHTAMAAQRLRTAISLDRQWSNPGVLGRNLDMSAERRRWNRLGPRVQHLGINAVSYTGYP